jgi:uncharacterized membrane-anchored protein YhcB (DUF1043 family)
MNIDLLATIIVALVPCIVYIVTSRNMTVHIKEDMKVMREDMKAMREDMDRRFTESREDMKVMREDMKAMREDMDRRFTEVHEDMNRRFDNVDRHFESIEVRLRDVEKAIVELRSETKMVKALTVLPPVDRIPVARALAEDEAAAA